MKLGELLRGTDVCTDIPELEISGIASDSRRVRQGYIFICIRGIKRDGHTCVSEAVSNGAVCVIAEEQVPADVPVLITASARVTESVVWYNFMGRPTDGMTKIAVTGTAGKTTVAFVLRHIFASAGRHVGVITTISALAGEKRLTLGENGGSSVSDIDGAMTTPDPEYFFGAAAEMKKEGCDTLIYEASSQSLLLHKTDAISPDAAVFTNLSHEHLDCHGTMENYFSAKARLMESAKIGITNADDTYMSRLTEMFPRKRIITCSRSSARISETDVCAIRCVSHGADGVEYVYFSDEAVFRVKTPLIGMHSIFNTMQAASCAIALGVEPMTVKEALSDMNGVDGRLCRVRFPQGCDYRAGIFIDYAHTPEALEAALSALSKIRRGSEIRRGSKIRRGRLIVLFGCGGDRDPSKRPKMARVAEKLSDLVIITGDNPRTEDPERIIDDIVRGLDGSKPHIVIPNRREAVIYAVREAREGDIVLLAGKGHEKYEIDGTGKHPFDEEQIVIDTVCGENDGETF